MIPRLLQPLVCLHRNTRGNIAVLLLLTIFCLVGLIGLVWNTAELATRREALQTTADTSAHAAATWISRCTNLVAAQNMVICQDASAEVIWRAIPPTDKSVRTNLERELVDAIAMLKDGDPNYDSNRRGVLDALRRVDDEYAMANGAWQSVSSLSNQKFADQQQGINFRTAVRQAGEVLDWVSRTYVDGKPSAVAGWPKPPGPAGEGLRDLVAKWSAPPDPTPCLQAIIYSLDKSKLPASPPLSQQLRQRLEQQFPEQQLPILVQFESRTAPGVAQDVPGRVAAHKAEVFAAQQEMVAQVTPTISQQMADQKDFYKSDLTIATTGRGAQGEGPAQIQAPIVPADDASVAPEQHFDSLRGTTVSIDPINVHTDAAAIIWPTPESRSITIAGRRINFTVNCNVPGGWGHVYGAPIKRYFEQRVWNDQQTLSTYMECIDRVRSELAELLRELRGLPADQKINGLPATLRDSVPDAMGNFAQVPVLPRLTAPDDASEQLRAQVAIYNQHASAYTSRVRGLADVLRSWARYYYRFTVGYAQIAWRSQIDHFLHVALKQLGTDKQFMVLATYRLRHIPDWAQAGMRTSAETAIRDRIVAQNIGSVGQNILNALIGADPNNAGNGFLDPTGRNTVLAARYSPEASQAAFAAINAVAAEVAPQIAAEWVSRPWPYEITPPDTRVPPSQGIGKDDRQTYFTVLTAARPTKDNLPRFILPKLTQTKPPELLAYAQAEAFNWMEFNEAYGGRERFDEVTPDRGGWSDAQFLGCPLPWRLSTIGGWNWNSRLAVSDALSASIASNPGLETFFTEGGVTNNDPEAIDTLTLH